MSTNFEQCYQALKSRDRRFDSQFFVGVSSTGVYCRPICPARLPKPENCTFFSTAAAAEQTGLRPCKRCRPELARCFSRPGFRYYQSHGHQTPKNHSGYAECWRPWRAYAVLHLWHHPLNQPLLSTESEKKI
ncbi:Ada metal-binding domain-containing protein [Parendozoicomonas sp. Alg238-R29]|uniref:Ada metal-binding domain-containing protein n=1 Tax=Parendozoicomonas sp. Alg238-R29 TaxID=2993446 RepID=UPI00248D9949|nr:Ada metal-binding domain-containing protein [Parendozoicomonas sp. Alg238-R29]